MKEKVEVFLIIWSFRSNVRSTTDWRTGQMQLEVSNDDDDTDNADDDNNDDNDDNDVNDDNDDRWRNPRRLESFEGQNKIDSIYFQDSL